MSERLKKQETFDLLGDILETLRFKGSIFFQSDLSAPWGMSLDNVGFPRFHIVLSGECFVGSGDQKPIKIRETDIVVLPHGSSHWIADRPGRALVSSQRAGAACELGNPLFQVGDVTNRLVCGLVQFDTGASHPILRDLPEVMHFPMNEAAGSVWSIVNLIDLEMREHGLSNNRIADRLTEVLFMQLLNHYVNNNQESRGFLAALSDRRVYHALTLIHQQPGFDWTLENLGEQVGMSRATLVRRFRDVIGMAPMAYISDWRIIKAYNLVKCSAAPLEQVAMVTGFASSRSLSRAFKRHYGYTPNELRRENF